MNKMKACVRPAMCKPYGKQSESLQKSKVNQLYIIAYMIWILLNLRWLIKYINLNSILILVYKYILKVFLM